MKKDISRRTFLAVSAVAATSGLIGNSKPALAEGNADNDVVVSSPNAIPYDQLNENTTYDEFVQFGEKYLSGMPDPKGVSAAENDGISAYTLEAAPSWSSSGRGPKVLTEGNGNVFLDQALRVIDVSVWNGENDWNAAKASGVDAAILRISYGTGVIGENHNIDKWFESNLAGCRNAGMPFGIYAFSYAENAAAARGEAYWNCALMERYGINKDVPFFIDLEKWEDWTGSDGRYHRPPNSAGTYDSIARAYVSTLKNKGYWNVHIYSYLNYLNGVCNTPFIRSYASWVAQYNSVAEYDYKTAPNLKGWQYTSSEDQIGGIGLTSEGVDVSAFPLFFPFSTLYSMGGSANVSRIAGNDSWDTAAAISKKTFSSSSTAVLARGDDFADAMSATGLAGVLEDGKGAPILLTDRNSLSKATLDELRRLGVKTVYLIGGEVAIKKKVADDLTSAKFEVKRIAGNEAYDTSVVCAKEILKLDPKATSKAIVAYSQNFQDALSISSFAYKYHVPIFLQTYGKNSSQRKLTKEATSLLKDTWGKATIYVPGGDGAVATSTVEGVFGSGRVVRKFGNTGYDTSNELATYFVKEGLLSTDTVVFASGAPAPKGVDALAGAAIAGRSSAPVILLNNNPDMGDYGVTALEKGKFLQSNYKSVKAGYVLGGTTVMSDSMYRWIKQII